MAAERGYGNQVRAYFEFLMDNVSKIRMRKKSRSIIDSIMDYHGGNAIGGPSPKVPEQTIAAVCRAELETRLNLLDGKRVKVKPSPAGYLPRK